MTQNNIGPDSSSRPQTARLSTLVRITLCVLIMLIMIIGGAMVFGPNGILLSTETATENTSTESEQ